MQNNSEPRQDYVDLPALSPGETSWAQATTETEDNSSNSRQSYFDQNINSSRGNDDVLFALDSGQGKSGKEKRISSHSVVAEQQS